ncbi:DUF429 domain-containing protein [Actinomycetota bacterium]
MTSPGSRRVIGMDAWTKGWVAVSLLDGAFAGASIHPTAAGAIEAAKDASAIGIDIPIGMPSDGVRQADVAARGRVGPRRSSVFNVPPRPVIEAEPYAAANRLSKERYGRGLSRQSYALRDKVLEVDMIARGDKRIFEVHPEVTFAKMSDHTLQYKKTWDGMNARRRLLRAAGIDLPADLGPVGVVPVDDILDAAAVAWTADRIAKGTAEAIPAETEFDGNLRMAIWV